MFRFKGGVLVVRHEASMHVVFHVKDRRLCKSWKWHFLSIQCSVRCPHMMEEITQRNTIHSCLRFQYFETGWSTLKNIDNKYDKASIDVVNQSFTCELTRIGMQDCNCSKRPSKI